MADEQEKETTSGSIPAAKNIAVVISVDEYATQRKLPGAQADATIVAKLLNEARRFDHVHTLVGKVESHVAKDKLAEIVASHRGTAVRELFVYLSGHGDIHDEAFHFLLSDFNASRYATTSLANDEIDDFARTLAPDLFVKVVDACRSGISYIKGPDDLRQAVQPAHGIRKCYFMYSSHQDQSSWQGKVSDFTLALATAVIEHPSPQLRYRDLQAYVSDYFEASKRQRPFFVSQADNTEIFISVNERVQAAVKEAVASIEAPPPFASAGNKELSLTQVITEDAKGCFQRDVTLAKIDEYYEAAMELELPQPLSELYDTEADRLDYSAQQVPGEAQLARWFESNAEEAFFIRTARAGEGEEQDGSAGGAAQRLRRPPFRKPPDTLFSTDDGLKDCVLLRLRPRYPNIPMWNVLLLAIPSRRTIATPFVRVRLEEVAWDDHKPKEYSLRTRKTPIAEFDATRSASDVMAALAAHLDATLRKQFGLASALEEPQHESDSQNRRT